MVTVCLYVPTAARPDGNCDNILSFHSVLGGSSPVVYDPHLSRVVIVGIIFAIIPDIRFVWDLMVSPLTSSRCVLNLSCFRNSRPSSTRNRGVFSFPLGAKLAPSLFKVIFFAPFTFS